MNRFQDSWFDVAFDEAVEALEREEVLCEAWEEEEANRFF